MNIKFKEKKKQEEVYVPPQASPEDLIEFEDYVPEIDPRTKRLIDLHEAIAEVDPTDAPLLSVLEAWEARHKVLYVSKISQDSEQFYVFTTIKRNDFKKLQETGVFDNEEKGNEVLVEKCLLYPKASTSWRLTSDAGIISTLGKQIAYKSGFVSAQEALALIKIV